MYTTGDDENKRKVRSGSKALSITFHINTNIDPPRRSRLSPLILPSFADRLPLLNRSDTGLGRSGAVIGAYLFRSFSSPILRLDH